MLLGSNKICPQMMEKIMKLTFLGADHEVTGSMHYVETKDLRFIVDCGMEQGKDIYANEPLPVPYSDLDYILLTHAHIDHSGMIPKAVREGFNGTVITTAASMDLDEIMLMDSAYIQEQDAETQNRKARRAGKPLVEPEYTVEDAQNALSHFKTVDYGVMTELSDTVNIRFTDAGHLLGSASIEVWINEDGVQKKLVFSGDIGNDDKPLIRGPRYIHEADYVVMESTYGNRHHEKSINHLEDLRKILQETLDRGGNAIIPAFAVGRTQELLYLIRELKSRNMIKGHDGFPVYVDSPMALKATSVFKENLVDCYDEETKALVESGINPLDFDGLKLSKTTEDSKAILYDPEPKVVIAAAGMCNAGRIRHHLKHNLWKSECSVIFAGYQAEGTLGRALQDGADTIKIFGEEISVKAHIETMKDMSSHADEAGLVKWAEAFGKAPGGFILVHGQDDSMKELAQQISSLTGNTVECPFSGSVLNLATGIWEKKAEPVYRTKEKAITSRNENVNNELIRALNSLTRLVEQTIQGANKDKMKLARRINELVEKLR